MDKEKSTTTAANSFSSGSTIKKPNKLSSLSSSTASEPSPVAAAITTTNSTAMLPGRVHRILQNFLLIWLDTNIDESKQDFINSLTQLRHLVASITTFTGAQECVNFLRDIKKEKVFMIVSGSLGQQILPEIHAWPQLDSIYVFCGNPSLHEQWAKTMFKVKGVHNDIEPICKALQSDRERCDRSLISISFHGTDALFMYTQLVKEVLLEIDDDDAKSIKELVEYCRLQDDIAEDEIKQIEQEYHSHTPIWWYTAPYFIHSMLNRGLRVLDVDIILKMGFFIRHLHRHIEQLHRQQQSKAPTGLLQVYRGQGLSLQDFEKMKQTKGGLMSFNNFLSTSRNRDISLKNFARPAALDTNSVGILFVMTIDPKVCDASSSLTPFADVTKVSYYQGQEKETLFSTHTIFRIDKIERIVDDHTDRLWQVNLTFTGNDHHDLNTLAAHIRKKLSLMTTGWSRLGRILSKIGQSAKAEQLYQLLLKEASSDNDQANYNSQFGRVFFLQQHWDGIL
ncbi:unnamed protein product [Rotaria sp. Silwood2]|nr:unnamed protein product [Rotaria sp. Silwood2]CAF4341914.1 unnamed protein product [Rotaria sp. Silwood2]